MVYKGVKRHAGKAEKYALLSVYDKSGIADFAKLLASLGYKIISSGGTAKHLSENGVSVIPVEDFTGNPESFDGRLKTISFRLTGGILFDRRNPRQAEEAKKLGIKPIDIVAVNLYPFEERPSIENIDVGGATMLRAAAKNFKNVLVLVDPKDYDRIGHMLKTNSEPEIFMLKLRQELAAKAIAHTAFYDAQIARFLSKEAFLEELTLAARKRLGLRFGENPHQKAALYLEPNTNSPLANLKRLWGRRLSLVNLTDINAGLESTRIFDAPAAVVIKHNSPAGIALGRDAAEALERAIEADPVSAFGGAIVINRPMDAAAARVIASFKDERASFIDIVAAPKIEKDALGLLRGVRKSMGIYTFGQIPKIRKNPMNFKWVDGGFVWQTGDLDVEESFAGWETVTQKKPTEAQIMQMRIAWKFITRIRSNAVIVVDPKLPMTRGIGSGQTSRVGATRIALEQAGRQAKGAILASDSFFPFDDSVRLAGKYKIGAIVQQGGSINDQASIRAADELRIPMIFTHRRAFWH